MEVRTDLGIGSANTASTANAAGLGQEDFLRMLIAQLEHQDPLNPQDSTAFTAQLAQFSSLEQEIGMRASLEEISSALNQGDKGTAIEMIGKQVLAESPAFALGSDGAKLHFELAGASDATQLVIRNAGGAVVKSLELDAMPAGPSSIQWDGLGRSGSPLPAGIYHLGIEATANDQPVTATALVEAEVTGANVSASSPFLYLGELVVPLAGVREVRSTSAGATP